MYYCLIYYPNIDTSDIQKIRKIYDPGYEHIEAHLTLVFPIKTNSISSIDLVNHIQNVVKKFEPFEIRLNGFEKSWDNWLFLTVSDGRDKLTKIHDELYSGILEPYLRKDISFIPHITLGLFNQKGTHYTLKDPKAVPFDKVAYDKALAIAKNSGLDYLANVEKLSLIKLDDDLSKILETKEFKLTD